MAKRQMAMLIRPARSPIAIDRRIPPIYLRGRNGLALRRRYRRHCGLVASFVAAYRLQAVIIRRGAR